MIFTSMTEDELQMHIVQWLDASLPMGSVVHHSPNEGRRHVAYKVRLKKLGMAAGWPDLEIFVPDTGWNDLSRQRPDYDRTKAPIRRQLVSKSKRHSRAIALLRCLLRHGKALEPC
jgi:hypothetical protein